MASRWVDAARPRGSGFASSNLGPGLCTLLVFTLSAGLASAEQANAPLPEASAAPVASAEPAPAPPEVPPAAPARPPSKAARFVRTVGSEGRGVAGRSIGARAAFGVGGPTSASGEPNPSFGGAAYERAFGVFSGSGLSVRYFDELWFGGDTRDLTYSIDMDIAVGPEFEFAEGLFLRLRPSFRGTFRQDAGLSFNSLRFPGGEVALGVMTPEVELDLALHGALNLLGYFSGFGIDAPLAGGAYGASLSATFWAGVPLRLDLDGVAFVPRRSEQGIAFGEQNSSDGIVRYLGPDAGIALDAAAHACAHLWSHPQRANLRTGSPARPLIQGKRARDYWLSACVDFRYSRFSHTVDSASVAVPGFSLVFGKVSRLDPHGKP